MLGFVGLDDASEEVYRLLVSLGSASDEELAEKLGLAAHQVAATLAVLEGLGLVALSPVEPGRHVAAPPAVALGALLSQRKHELAQAERAVDTLAREHRRNAVGLSVHDLVEVVTGAAAVRHRFEQLQLGAEHEVLALVTSSPMAVGGQDSDAERTAVTRGVSYRVVIERASLDAPGSTLEVLTALQRDEEVRITERVPTKLIVADRALAMLPLRQLNAPGEPSALLVRAGGLLEALLGLFETVWNSALPLRLGRRAEQSAARSPAAGGVPARPDAPAHAAAGVGVGAGAALGPGAVDAVRLDELEAHGVVTDQDEQPEDVDLQILSLLLVGMTDVSVAKQLDLGLRTVQRRVKRLMDLAEVTTRMQLGWHAYERGWVARR